MWAFWVCFIIFLADPRWAARHWPLPTVDVGGADLHPFLAAMVDLLLIALFGVQHSIMARPWFKARIMHALPEPFERCTFVHGANIVLFTMILFWQPIPIPVWEVSSAAKYLIWAIFVSGWLTLLFGALSFGVFDLLGIAQMRAWCHGDTPRPPLLKTGLLYTVFRHPMYVGVLTGVWATPEMTIGHMLLAAGMTLYVLIAMRYEERDLAARFGQAYANWRAH